MNGLEFLRCLNADPRLRIIPNVFLGFSPEKRDRIGSFESGVNNWIGKPKDFDESGKSVRLAGQYRRQGKQISKP